MHRFVLCIIYCFLNHTQLFLCMFTFLRLVMWTENQCYKPTLSMMPANYTMLTVMPGGFLVPVAEAPAPALQVVEPPISFEVPVPASSPAPSPTVVKPSAASKLSLTFTSTLAFASLLLCILLWKGRSSVFPIVLSFCPSNCVGTQRRWEVYIHIWIHEQSCCRCMKEVGVEN